MPKKIEMVGKRFGRLRVISKIRIDKHRDIKWMCKCDCGKNKEIGGKHLRSGHTKSCGCLMVETITTHGMSYSSTYRTWKDMIQRCFNKNCICYKNYGGRGIKISDRWLKFKAFYKDMGTKPKGLTIERIDNDKGYYKENCAWETYITQARNKRLSSNNNTGVAGVHWYKQTKKYRVSLCEEGKTHHIGYFSTIDQAIVARKQAEKKYWPERIDDR